jgi:hypothetical protein
MELSLDHQNKQTCGVSSFTCLSQSTTSAVLLQVLLFHRHACEALDEDALLELADWAVRKLAHLNSGAAHAYANAPGALAFAGDNLYNVCSHHAQRAICTGRILWLYYN